MALEHDQKPSLCYWIVGHVGLPILVALVVVMTCVFLISHKNTSEENIASQIRWRQEQTNSMMRRMWYVKDPRTGICFAYYWGGTANGGGLATVPESAIPKDLLIVAEIKE